jgi:hypothetical protein
MRFRRPILAALGAMPLCAALAACDGAEKAREPDSRSVAAAEKSRERPPETLWERTYGGPRIDAARRVVPWGEDGFAVLGRTRSKGQGGDDVWLLFLDKDGRQLGERLIGTPDFDWPTAMLRTRDGGLVLTGSRTDRAITRSSGWAVRLDEKGDELWRRDYDRGNPEGTSGLTAIDELPDGGFVAAGSTTRGGAGQYDGWVLRLDKEGKPVWAKTFGGGEQEALFAVAALPDGGAVATGSSGLDGQGWVLRLDPAGATQWEKRFGGSGYDVFNAVAPVKGGFVVAGTTRSKGPAGGAAWVMRLDERGEPVWERLLTPVMGASANAVLALADGGFLVLGGSVAEPGLGNEKERAWIARLGADGAVLWTRAFESAGDENLFSAMMLPDGGFALAGFTNAKGAGEGDFWLLRLGYK